MALPARPMHVPAGLPIDESTRPELLDVGKANISNVNVRAHDRGSLGKRLGFGELPLTRLNDSDRATGYKLFAHNGVPTVIDGTHLDSYVEQASTNVTRSRVSECTYRLIDIPTPSSSAYLYDIEYCDGFAVVAYGTTFAGTCKVAVIDASTGAVILSPETLGSGDGLVVLGSYGNQYVIAFVYNGSSTAITAYILNIQALELGWSTLATVAASTGGALPSVCSLSNRVAIAYGTSSGSSRVAVQTYNASGLLQSTTLSAPLTPEAVSIDGSITGTLWVAFSQIADTYVVGLDADALSTVLATETVALNIATGTQNIGICEGPTAGTARVWALSTSATVNFQMCGITTSGGAAVAGAASVVRNAVPASRPFLHGGRYYMAVAPSAVDSDLSGNEQGLCVFVDWTDDVTYLRPIANIEPGLVPGEAAFCKVVSAGSSSKRLYGFQLLKSGKRDVLQLSLGNGATGCALVELDFASRSRWLTADHANSSFIGGALTCVYDGERVTEAGFLAAPPAVSGAVAGTGITGTYRCVAIYEDVDAAGNWVVSGISGVSGAVVAADDTITWTTEPITVSSRIAKGSTRVAYYRTLNGGEPPYYRLGAVENDTTQAASFPDNIPDATLSTRAKLYAPNLTGAAGEALDRLAPPGLLHLASYNGMLVGAKGESLLFSGQEVYGEATWFSPVFEAPITGGGDITGLRALDGTLFVFKADRIFAVAGEAPSDNGLQGGLGAPVLIASDVGCIEPNSLLATSLGIFFQSRRGIELLSRARTVEPIGEQVQATLAAYPYVTSAVLDERNGLARFTLAGGIDPSTGLVAQAGGEGGADGNSRDVIFDLTLKSWISTDRKYGAVANEGAQSAAQIYVDDEWRYAWLGTDGRVYFERSASDDNAYLDAGALNWIESQYELPPWKMGLQQEQRIYEMELLAERHTPAGITIEIANDYGDYDAANEKPWTVAETEGESQFPFRPKSLTTAVQLRVKDTAPEDSADYGSGRGFTFIGISADIAAKQGTTRGTTRLNPELRR